MDSPSHFFAYMARMKFIQRWGVMRNTQSENIQEHSLQAAILAHALAVIARDQFGRDVDPERVMALAVFHDASEVITGDLPSPIKHHDPELSSAYGRIEEAARERVASLELELQQMTTEYEGLRDGSLIELEAQVEAALRNGLGVGGDNDKKSHKFAQWFFGPFGEENSRRLGV